MNKSQRGFTGGIKAVDIKRDFYTMATADGESAEIVMYGEIVEERPTSWRTGEPVQGNFIVLSEFLDDLTSVASAKTITLRLNSVGGDAFSAIPIHNRLRELKGNVTAIVDGVAFSGGSLIMCAADTVQVNPSSLIMIHKCWTSLFGGYNADEMRDYATKLDSIDKAQAAIYVRKTGNSENDVLALMSEETYLTGAEAIAKGLADELLDSEDAKIAASADMRTLYVNGRATRFLNPLVTLPESVPTVTPAEISAVLANNQPTDNGGTEGGKTMAKTLDELKKENLELAAQLMAEAAASANAAVSAAAPSVNALGAAAEATVGTDDAVKAERQRLADIDALAAMFDADTIREAKYGENPCTAQEMTYRAAQKSAKQGKSFLAAAKADADASGTADVGAAGNAPEAGTDGDADMTPEQLMAKGVADAKAMNKKED